ncbi:MetS family NSS transporter small subunit [Jeotgalibacillus marinus]|uniref:MetS family NSS transporter small subunit n=1 Tax=Jeotgalibacillus marinus TaxID=86667 RepID=A0ABV3Q410_9BACL
MSMGAIVMMIVGIGLLWGGLTASIVNAVRKSRKTA